MRLLSERAGVLESLPRVWHRSSDPVPSMIDAMATAYGQRHTGKAGVPVIPGSDGSFPLWRRVKENRQRNQHPVIAKATAGGGGKGMRIINNESEFKKVR